MPAVMVPWPNSANVLSRIEVLDWSRIDVLDWFRIAMAEPFNCSVFCASRMLVELC